MVALFCEGVPVNLKLSRPHLALQATQLLLFILELGRVPWTVRLDGDLLGLERGVTIDNSGNGRVVSLKSKTGIRWKIR